MGLAWPGLESMRAKLLLPGLEAGAGSVLLVVDAGAAVDSLTLETWTSDGAEVDVVPGAGGVVPDVEVGAASADHSDGYGPKVARQPDMAAELCMNCGEGCQTDWACHELPPPVPGVAAPPPPPWVEGWVPPPS